jgi:dUTP pyrophosphatase
MLRICCVLTNPAAKPPSKSKDVLDAGHDLFTPEPFSLAPGERITIKTGLVVWYEPVPGGAAAEAISWYGRLAPKSGLAAKNGIDVLGAVVDRMYCGPEDELRVVLLNTGHSTVEFAAGAPICQIIPELIALCENMIAVMRPETPRLDSRGGLGSGLTS